MKDNSKPKSLGGGNVVNILLPVISVGLLLLLWCYEAQTHLFLASPVETVERFIKLIQFPLMGETVWMHIFASVRRIFVAFIFASIVGVTLGVCFGIFPTFRRVVYPVFAIIRPIPPLAWIPIIILWCGVVGDLSKDIIIFIGIVMAIVINTFAATAHTDELLLKAGKSLGANKTQMLFDIILPDAIPTIVAGMKTGLSTGWMSLVAAEMIASKQGLGFIVTMSMNGIPDTALDFVGIILIAISSSIMTALLTLLERKLCPWLNLDQE